MNIATKETRGPQSNQIYQRELMVSLKSQHCTPPPHPHPQPKKKKNLCDTVASVLPVKLFGLSFALFPLDRQLKDYSSEPVVPWPGEIYQLQWISARKPPGRLSRPNLWPQEDTSKDDDNQNVPRWHLGKQPQHLESLASKAWNFLCSPVTSLTLSGS